ncbi:hypothetical protein PJI17_31175, partial [Mycobacterium kansasii]
MKIKHVPRSENAKADALASLAAALSCTNRSPLHVTIEERSFLPSAEVIEEIIEAIPISCLEVTTDDWRQPFIDYLKYNILPEDLAQRQQIKQRSSRFIICREVLYRKSYKGMLLRCLDKEKSDQILLEHTLKNAERIK